MAKDPKDTQTATSDKKISEMTQEEVLAFLVLPISRVVLTIWLVTGIRRGYIKTRRKVLLLTLKI